MFVLGGPMMGRMVDNADAFAKEVVTKTSGGLIILPRGHYLHRNATTPPQFHASPRRFGLYPVPQLFRAVPPPPPRPSF